METSRILLGGVRLLVHIRWDYHAIYHCHCYLDFSFLVTRKDGDLKVGDAVRLAEALKALPLTLAAPRPIDEAISTAGGVAWSALDPGLMLHRQPGVFCAGEMLDWEAPTGGYLLTACVATGRAAGQGVLRWWASAR